MKKNALLIIDPQNSFCNPGDAQGNSRGSLYVEGASEDMKRLASWIDSNNKAIDDAYRAGEPSVRCVLCNHYSDSLQLENSWSLSM